MKKRQSEFKMSDKEMVLQEIRENEFQQSLWKKYQKQYSYAKDTTFDKAIDAVEDLMKGVENI